MSFRLVLSTIIIKTKVLIEIRRCLSKKSKIILQSNNDESLDDKDEGKSLRFCGTSLNVDNFSEGLLCLSTSGNYTQVEILNGNS